MLGHWRLAPREAGHWSGQRSQVHTQLDSLAQGSLRREGFRFWNVLRVLSAGVTMLGKEREERSASRMSWHPLDRIWKGERGVIVLAQATG